jgi:Na+-transporting methylmalonyl-CoA/oxaloacetate decarboxylase gamma subunit
MSLGMTLVMLIVGWLAVAAAMLWGVLRISRRHHPHYRSAETAKAAPVVASKHRHAAAH